MCVWEGGEGGAHIDLVAYWTQDVSRLGVKPETFQCTWLCSKQLSHTVWSGHRQPTLQH